MNGSFVLLGGRSSAALPALCETRRSGPAPVARAENRYKSVSFNCNGGTAAGLGYTGPIHLFESNVKLQSRHDNLLTNDARQPVRLLARRTKRCQEYAL